MHRTAVGWAVAAAVLVVVAVCVDPAQRASAFAARRAAANGGNSASGGSVFGAFGLSDGGAAARVDAALANGTCVAMFVATDTRGLARTAGTDGGSAWLLQGAAAEDAAGVAFTSLRGEARVATFSV